MQQYELDAEPKRPYTRRGFEPHVSPWPCKRCGGPIETYKSPLALQGREFCGQVCEIWHRHDNPEYQCTYFCTGCKTTKTRTHFPTSVASHQRMQRCGECMAQTMARRRVGPAHYRKLHAQAKSRGIDCIMSVQDWDTFVGKPCFWCGIPLPHPRLDRLDSDGPYTRDNCVAACFFCNRAKGSAPPGKWLAHIRAIAANHPEGPVEQYLSPNYNKRRRRTPPPPTR